MPEPGKILQIVSVSCSLLGCVGYVLRSYLRKRPVNLVRVLMVMLSASLIPTGVWLLLCAFDPTLLSEVSGLNLYLAVAGVALIFIAIRGIISNQ